MCHYGLGLQEMSTSADELRRSLTEAEQTSRRLNEEAGAVRRKLESYEDSFKQIKEATGVRCVAIVVSLRWCSQMMVATHLLYV